MLCPEYGAFCSGGCGNSIAESLYLNKPPSPNGQPPIPSVLDALLLLPAALCGIINKDIPDIVIFVSKYSHDKFIESYKKEDIHYENIKIDFVYHFSSRYWKNTEGKFKFENLLREYWFWGNAKCQKLRTIHSELRQIFKIEKELECFFDKNGIFLSRLLFKLKDVSFYC